jgi:polyhydroxybutyrate depolymerase
MAGRLALVVVLFAMVAAGCADDDEPQAGPPSTTASTSTSTTSTTAAARPSEGCGGRRPPSGGPGEVVRTIESSGTQRSYRLTVPSDVDPTTPLPLVLNLHGSGSNALQQSAYSRLPTVAVTRDVIVVTPDAIANNWRLSAPSDDGNPDIRLARDLLDALSRELCVDRRRVYAAGLSLGAAFSALLACALPDDIAAVGLVTVEVLIGPCPNSVPVIAFHGTADAVVPYDGGEVRGSEFRGSTVRGAEGNMVRWAELGGCGTEPERSEVGSGVTRRVYPDCDDGTEVELYTIDGGGHTWPGSPIDVARLGANTDQIDATDLILDFFAEHPLPER